MSTEAVNNVKENKDLVKIFEKSSLMTSMYTRLNEISEATKHVVEGFQAFAAAQDKINAVEKLSNLLIHLRSIDNVVKSMPEAVAQLKTLMDGLSSSIQLTQFNPTALLDSVDKISRACSNAVDMVNELTEGNRSTQPNQTPAEKELINLLSTVDRVRSELAEPIGTVRITTFGVQDAANQLSIIVNCIKE